MKIKILVADDHHLIRQGFVKLIGSDPSFEVTAEAEDGLEALNKIRALKPDVAVLDISMPRLNGLVVAKKAMEEKLPVEFVILTMYEDEEYLIEAMEIGIKGYILKENTAQDLATAIKYAAAGKKYISPLISGHLAEQYKKEKLTARERTSMHALTPAEFNILRLISENKTSKEIAGELCLSRRTVQNHRNNMRAKLGLRGANALLAYAIENKKGLKK
ncbi:MAG: response regulator transcription factor [Nitrospinae bacterium]|nr:response regulator transcription factor [Nitrospinota bacterium]